MKASPFIASSFELTANRILPGVWPWVNICKYKVYKQLNARNRPYFDHEGLDRRRAPCRNTARDKRSRKPRRRRLA
jgi:hypothetical protein